MKRGKFIKGLFGGLAAVVAAPATAAVLAQDEPEPEWYTPESPVHPAASTITFNNPNCESANLDNVELKWDVNGDLWATKGRKFKKLI